MNAAEHVVKLWLESQEYFVMGPLKIGQNEIDLLAIQLNPCRDGISNKLHIEVTVSGRPGGPDDGTGVIEYAQSKFCGKHGRIENKARALLGTDYKRWAVIGKILGGREREWIEQGPTLTPPVRVISFEQVVKEYVEYASNRPASADQIGRFLDTLSQLGFLRP